LPALKLPSPISSLDGFHPDYQVYIKREDLIHPDFGGNKWRKLKLNLDAFQKNKHDVLLTFGGAFSNHIAATAAACLHYDIPCIGFIRGEYVDPSNPTLAKAKKQGMELVYLNKEEYKKKETASKVLSLLDSFENPLVVPEGGQNQNGIEGCSELATEIENDNLHYDYLVVSGGTGTTASGIIKGLNGPHKIVINALKNPSLVDAISANLNDQSNWEVNNEFHCGGFAKTNEALQTFAQSFFDKYKIQLDPIYNSKSLYALLQICESKRLKPNSKILYIHTGGHQGIEAWNYRYKKNWIDLS